jgi:SEC-C motif domain protein
MRSRYSAYARGEAAYLIDTWHPGTRHRDLDLDPGVRWIDLRILATEGGGPGDQDGRVEFVARFKIGGRAHRLHENSRFQRHQGRWYYVDGDLAGTGTDPEPGT